MNKSHVNDVQQYEEEFVCDFPDGHAMYRRKEGHGGWSYWTTHIQPQVMVYDEGISSPLHMFYALDHLGYGKSSWLLIGRALGYIEADQ